MADQKVQQDLDSLLKQTSSSSDNLTQRAVVDAKAGAPATLTTDTGYMWIGSMQASNLITPGGATVLPDAVKTDGQYLTALDIYLRQGLPDPTTYSQNATVASCRKARLCDTERAGAVHADRRRPVLGQGASRKTRTVDRIFPVRRRITRTGAAIIEGLAGDRLQDPGRGAHGGCGGQA